MDCKHNKIIRIITPTPRHQCLSCGAEFVPADEAEDMRHFAVWVGFTAGVVAVLILGLLMMVVL